MCKYNNQKMKTKEFNKGNTFNSVFFVGFFCIMEEQL